MVSEEMRLGARNCILDWARVRETEQVLLLHVRGHVEPSVIETFRLECERAGSFVSELICPVFNPRIEEPLEPVIQALQGADVVFFFCPYPALLHSKSGKKAMVEYGLRNVPVLTNTAELLGSEWARFPVPLQLELHRRSAEIVSRSPRIRVTAANGTEIEGLAPPVQRVNRSEVVHGLAWHGIWPGECGPCLTPMQEMNGRLVIDVLPGFQGFLQEKVVVDVHDNRIRSIHGGKEARWFSDLIESSMRAGCDDADVLHELQWGVNPKGRIERAVLQCEEDEVEISRLARTVHFGFGSGQKGFHWDTVIVDHFDIEVGDGTKIYEDGRLVLLDDPEIRALASRFGDPDEVLREISQLDGREDVAHG